MKLFRHFIFLLLILPFCCFSQNNLSEKDFIDNVFICLSEVSKTFHSHDECIGLETCEEKLEELSEEIAIRKFDRAVCCICWTNPGDDCKNDNPNATYEYDEENDERRREVFFEDFWWL